MTLSTAALVTSVSSQTVARSGYFKITGSNFGASQDSSSYLLVNSLSAIVVRWTDSEIAGYIPEASSLGSFPVQVATAAGTSNAINVNVTMRPTSGRIRWRAEMAGDYAENGAVIAPATVPGAGTIYVATNAGLLYAWAPDGSLKWVGLGADGDTQASIGADGTIYTGGTDGTGSPAVIAWDPNGTQKWKFADPNGRNLYAGPNVGPDGKIYAIFRPLNAQSLNLAAIRPDGSLAWSVNRNFYKYGQPGSKEIAFGRTTQYLYFAFDVDPDPDPTFTNGGFFAYDFNGNLVWQRGGLCCGVPAVAPDGDLRHYGMRLNAQTGATVYAYDFPPQGAYGTSGLPDVGPTNIHYAVNHGTLWAINPNGSQKWRYIPLAPDGSWFFIQSSVVNPTNTAILMAGGGSYGEESLFLSVDPMTGQEQWRQFLPREPGYEPYGTLFFSPQAVYSADGNTGYMAADINGDQSWPYTQQKICVLYSVNVGASDSPINQPPQVTITNPLTNSNVARNVPINVTARVQDDGAIDRVEFHYAHNSTSVDMGTDTTPDANGLYSASFTPTDPGGYSIYVVAYDVGGLRGDAPYVSVNINNELPQNNWVSPANGAVFTAPPSITLTAHATDVDGTVTKVEFNSSQVGSLGTDTTADAAGNYSVVWANPAVGTQYLSAWATDNDGYRTDAIISVTVVSGPILPVSISGQVTSQSGVGVSNVSMQLGPLSGAVPVTIATNATGNYSFTNVVTGDSYTVTPSKTRDTNGVTAFDASMAARYAASLLSLTPNQMIAADASDNGTVSAFDASMIARTAAGIANNGIAGTWKFTPANRVFNNPLADQLDQNFAAILVGDVSGNWIAQPGIAGTYFAPTSLPVSGGLWTAQLAGDRPGLLSSNATMTASLPSKNDPPGAATIIPIMLGDANGQNVFSYDFDLMFDPSVLQPQVTPFDAAGTLSNGWSVSANTATAGHLVLNAFSTSAMSGQGTLLFLKFNVVGGANSQTAMAWQSFRLNEGAPASSTINGFFTASGPTAQHSTLSGRIVTETGNPLAGVVLTLIGSQGARKVITDAAGGYRFTGAETGQFYTITPTLANHTFSPTNRSFSLLADKTDAVFTAAAVPTQTENAIDSTEYFVRQQYLDFLGREPDQGGLTYWSDRINQCQADVTCISSRRIDISAAFFVEQEFQASASFIYDLYTGTLGRRPAFAEYAVDRRAVVGGANLEADKTAFARNFVQRAEFAQKYQPQTTAESFVEALLQRTLLKGVDLSSERADLIGVYNGGTNVVESRAAVVRALADNVTFKESQYNPAFVLAEYFSYLRRDPDQGGYDFWLNVLNNRPGGNYRGMVCSFITSSEYQRRFSVIVSNTNRECGN